MTARRSITPSTLAFTKVEGKLIGSVIDEDDQGRVSPVVVVNA